MISGVLDSLKREEAEDLIRRHGGKVCGDVTCCGAMVALGIGKEEGCVRLGLRACIYFADGALKVVF